MSFDGGATFTPVTVNPDGTINLVVPANTSSVTLKVPTTDDTISEGAETIKLTAGTPANGATPLEGTGTIVDNDGAPTAEHRRPGDGQRSGWHLDLHGQAEQPKRHGRDGELRHARRHGQRW